ncbi:hypothetical protein AI20_22020 [Aeromonas hydrophila YL17]|nr:hypothetical protein AI20_22020 [Aeromonas hydrophila YL17]
MLQKPSFAFQQGRRCALATAFELPQRVGSTDGAIRCTQLTKCIFTPCHPFTGFGIAAANIAQRVLPIGSAIAPLKIAERVLTPDHPLPSFWVATTHITQCIFTVSCSITALEVAQDISSPGDARARIPDIAESILTQDALLAIVTLIAGMAQCIFSIGAVGCKHDLRR